MKFVVYSKTGCPYCEKVKKVLELTDQLYVEYVLDENFTRNEFADLAYSEPFYVKDFYSTQKK